MEEIAPVTVNVYTNGTVIVNALTVTGAIYLPLLSTFTLTGAFTLMGATLVVMYTEHIIDKPLVVCTMYI